MTARRFSIVACFIILFGTFDFVSGDGRMTVSPSLSFYHENQPVDLVYRFESEKIDIGRRPFQENFTVTSHGEIIMHGYANAIHKGKPYVDLKLKVYKPGSYLGTITGSSSRATAVVKQIKGEEPVVVSKAGTSLYLQCSDDNLPEAKRFWKIGDTFVDYERSGWVEADDGALEIQKIELEDGSEGMGCFYFNGSGFKEVYQRNKSALLPHQTAFTLTPVIVYKALKTGLTEDSTKTQYAVQMASIKTGLTVEICGTLNGTAMCVQNVSVALDAGGANFTISLGNIDLYTGIDFEDVPPEQHPNGNNGALIAGIVIGVLFVIAIIAITIVVIYRKRYPKGGNSPEGEPEEMKKLKSPEKKNPV